MRSDGLKSTCPDDKYLYVEVEGIPEFHVEPKIIIKIIIICLKMTGTRLQLDHGPSLSVRSEKPLRNRFEAGISRVTKGRFGRNST